MPDTSTTIGWRSQLSTEYRLWTIDMVAALDIGDVINSVTATLVDLLTGASFPTGLAGAATFDGTSVTQAVSGLIAGHNYRLVLTANVGTSKLTAIALNLSVPY